jgi:hypothetical protein
VKEPQSNIQAVGDYLRADGPLEGKTDRFDPVSNSKERYGVQLNVEKNFMLTVRLQLEIMATGTPPKKSWDAFNTPVHQARLSTERPRERAHPDCPYIRQENIRE